QALFRQPPAQSSSVRRVRPPAPTLSPYTTLFRSKKEPAAKKTAVKKAPAKKAVKKAAKKATKKTAGKVAKKTVKKTVAAVEPVRSEEHTSELQSRENLVCRLLLEKRNGGRD